MTIDPVAVVERLRRATSAHDLDALVDCFAESYENETPVHPSRGFVGRAQVRANWEQIFAGVPDIEVELLRTSPSGDVVWSEWEMRGTRRDGVAHLMRGVVVFGIADDRIARARFYLEPVDPAGGDVDAAVRQVVVGDAA